MNTDTAKWFPFRVPNPAARIRLVCFPPAGGAASYYRRWANELAADCTVWAVQPPGRENRLREEPLTAVGDLVDRIGPCLLGGDPSMPVAFFGHSFGALVAFETARYLQARGRGPAHLFIAGARPPGWPSQRALEVDSLDDNALIDRIAQLGGIPQAVLADAELRELIVKPLRADYRALRDYQPQPQAEVNCPTTVLGGRQDGSITADDLDGWRHFVEQPITRHLFPGGHFFLYGDARDGVLDIVRQTLRDLVL